MDILFEKYIDTANLFLQENELEKSIENYEEALKLASIDEQKINIYNVLGRLYQKTKQPEKAIDMFNKSMELYNLSSSEETLSNKAAIHNNLAALYMESDIKSSINHYKSALEFYSALKDSEDKDFTPHIANTNFALAEVYVKVPDFYLAKKHYKEAIKLYDQLEGLNFDELKASAYYQLGNIYTEEFNLHDAKVNYLKSLSLFESLNLNDGQRFQPYVAAVYNNLGVTLKSMDDHKKALEYYEKAINHYEFLAKNQTPLFLPYVAATYNSLGILYAEISDFEKAIDYSHKTTTVYNELVNESPEEYTHYLATSLHNLGVFHFEIKDVTASEYYFNEALKMRKTLAANEPSSFNADVCATALNLLEVYQTQLEDSLDMSYKAKCMELLEDVNTRLQKHDDDDDDRPVIKSMKSDCKYYKEYFDAVTVEDLKLNSTIKKVDELAQEINSTIIPSEKIGYQQDIIKLLENIYKDYPENNKLKNELAYAYNDLAWLNLRLKKFNEAEKIILKAQTLEQPILPIKCNLAHSYLLQNKFDLAKDLYLEIKNVKNINNEPFAYTILKDFKTLKADGIDHDAFEKIEVLI